MEHPPHPPAMVSRRIVPVPSTKTNTEGTALFLMPQKSLREDFQKMLPGLFPTRLQSLAGVYSCKIGNNLKQI